MMWGNNPYFYSCGGNWAGQIISLAVTILVIVIVVRVIMRVVRGRGAGGAMPWWHSAENLLKERFVKGEISKEEYQEKLKVIRE
jgi:putative membrane protein